MRGLRDQNPRPSSLNSGEDLGGRPLRWVGQSCCYPIAASFELLDPDSRGAARVRGDSCSHSTGITRGHPDAMIEQLKAQHITEATQGELAGYVRRLTPRRHQSVHSGKRGQQGFLGAKQGRQEVVGQPHSGAEIDPQDPVELFQCQLLELTAQSYAGIVHRKRGEAILDHVLGKLGNVLNRLKIKNADPHCHRRVVACNTLGHCNQVRLIPVDEVQVAPPDGEMFR
jgi:hypothetical protein